MVSNVDDGELVLGHPAGLSRQTPEPFTCGHSGSLFLQSGGVPFVPIGFLFMTMKGRLKDWARIIKRDVHALYLASRDPRVPWYAKALALLVAGYALSPIDLIPDFIPVLGYLDDVILVPLGVLLVIRMIDPAIMAEHRELAAAVEVAIISGIR